MNNDNPKYKIVPIDDEAYKFGVRARNGIIVAQCNNKPYALRCAEALEDFDKKQSRRLAVVK